MHNLQRMILCWLIGSFHILAAGGPLSAAGVIKLTEVERGFYTPVYVTNAGDGTNRLFVVEQTGLVKVIQNGVLQARPFLDIRDKVYGYWVWGLFAIAFHPSYVRNHRFFVYYTRWTANRQMQMVVAEYVTSRTDPNQAAGQEKIILAIDYPPYAWHLGGQMAFGPDHLLYISTGDGSSEVLWNAGASQEKESMFGKLLRINVDSGSATADSWPFFQRFHGVYPSRMNSNFQPPAPKIWASGFRNPWRFSFDAATKRLFLGDVGQSEYEEVDLVVKNGNYGWPRMEGTHCYPPTESACDEDGLALPIFEYSHPPGFSDVAVIGGYVYRGSRMPGLRGSYIFGDNGIGDIWSLDENPIGVWSRRLLLSTGLYLVSFGQDEQGEIYTFDYLNGVLYRLDLDSVQGNREVARHVLKALSSELSDQSKSLEIAPRVEVNRQVANHRATERR